MKDTSKCIVSFATNVKVYHKPGCYHAQRIKQENRVYMTKKEAEAAGFRICRCCNGMNHHLRVEENAMKYYKNKKGMEFKVVNGALYVKTEIGCWKVVYSRREQWLVLYHRNRTYQELNFKSPQYESYHRQSDVPKSYTIEKYLDYIYEHDRFMQAEQSGAAITVFSSKKKKKLAEKSRQKQARKRVDYLFRMIEMQNADYRQLSYC